MMHIEIPKYILISLLLVSGCDSSNGESSPANTSTDTSSTPGSTASDTSDTSTTGPGDGILYSPCAMDKHLGGFEAIVQEEYSGIQGDVADGIIPGSIPTKELEEGGCILWKKQILSCDQPCLNDETCGFDGACIPAPTGQHLGTVTIDGLKKDISMEPQEPGNNYFDTTVPHPVFDMNDEEIRLQTTTGYLGAITLFGAGSNAVSPEMREWEIMPGQDLTVRWDAPPPESKTAIVLNLAVDQHGSTPVEMACIFEDTGQGVVPAAVIDTLLASGVTGFPSGKITRATADSVQVAQGCVDFVVKSYVTITVRVSGYVPCSKSDPTCPDGLECNTTTYICE